MIRRWLSGGGTRVRSSRRKEASRLFNRLAGLSFARSSPCRVEHRVHGSVVSSAIVLAADALLLLGIYIVFRTFRENSFAASTVRIEAEQPVISSGPYGWVRHPMYFGCVIGFAATPIALGSLWGLVPAVLKCGTLVVRLLYEEDFLAEFGGVPGVSRSSAVSIDSVCVVRARRGRGKVVGRVGAPQYSVRSAKQGKS